MSIRYNSGWFRFIKTLKANMLATPDLERPGFRYGSVKRLASPFVVLDKNFMNARHPGFRA